MDGEIMGNYGRGNDGRGVGEMRRDEVGEIRAGK